MPHAFTSAARDPVRGSWGRTTRVRRAESRSRCGEAARFGAEREHARIVEIDCSHFATE